MVENGEKDDTGCYDDHDDVNVPLAHPPSKYRPNTTQPPLPILLHLVFLADDIPSESLKLEKSR